MAIQSAVGRILPNYVYLEIGSHLGGSILPHLRDDLCSKIYSIDKRPLIQPDERGVNFGYPENSTERMLELLAKVSPTDKIHTIDGETGTLERSLIDEKPNLCFIDGEHTDAATKVDFEFCLDVLERDGGIIFHDAYVIYNAISDCIATVKKKGLNFKAYALPSVVFVIEIGDFPIHRNQNMQQLLLDNHKSYLFSLEQNDGYRRFTTSVPIKYLWKLAIKLGGKF
ncbi:MAG: hypothetical protein UZ17_ACD001001678 [Acidobacteria bacterium OLB17]|nr:MAG: hypothetical protein UZ17_ACD001001678 [Acidobacteria bacterium OLB17]